MQDVKSLQLTDDGEDKPTIEQLRDEVVGLRQAMDQANVTQGQPVEPPPEREVQKIFREAEEGRSPEQMRQAEAWVLRQIGGRLSVQQGPRGADGEGPREVIFDRYKVTPELRQSGKTNLPDGFTVTRSVPVPALARYYIKIILDEESYQSDAEKLHAIVASSKERGTHPTEFGFLFDAAGKLKPLQRRAARRRKRQ